MNKIIFFILAILILSIANASAATYYVSNAGNDANAGTSTASPWKSIAKVNAQTFRPGDIIRFRSGDIWREELIVSSSGTDGNPITFTGYGSGKNPLITSGELVTQGMWTKESEHIYSYNTKAADPAWLNPWGAIDKDHKLMSKYWPSNRDSLYSAPSSATNPVIAELENKMKDGFSWSPKDLGKIFIRSASADFGDVTVGKRSNCVFMNNQDYITFDGIDLEGPGGDITAGDKRELYTALFMAIGSTHITIRDSNLRNSVNGAIQLRDGSSYGLIENNTIEDIWSAITGYGPTHYVTVRKNTIRNIGGQVASGGDRGMTSTWGHHWLVEHNLYENHGWDGQSESELTESCSSGGNCQVMDYAFVSCCGLSYGSEESGDHVIRYNRYKNVGKGAILLRDGSRNSVYYNVIESWATSIPNTEETYVAAIYSPSSSVIPILSDIRIMNNVITGGKDQQGKTQLQAIHLQGTKKNSEVRNNIISGNGNSVLAFSWWSQSNGGTSTNVSFTHNIMDPPAYQGKAVRWNSVYYASDRMVSPTGCPNAGYWQCDQAEKTTGKVNNNLVADPLFNNPTSRDYHLKTGSPGIDSGVNMGLAKDFEGKSVPAGSAPDRGAFETGGTSSIGNCASLGGTCCSLQCTGTVKTASDCDSCCIGTCSSIPTCASRGGTCCSQGTCSGSSLGTFSDCAGVCCSSSCLTTCASLGGTCCSQGTTCTTATQSASDCQLCCVGGYCKSTEREELLHYPFDSWTPGIAKDKTGRHDGTFVGNPTQVQGRVGNAAMLDGIDDAIVTGDAVALNPKYLTAAFWIRPDSLPDNAGIIAKGDTGHRQFWVWMYKGNLSLEIDGGGLHNHLYSLRKGRWQHLAITYDGSAIVVYADGIESKRIQQTGEIMTDDDPLSIGRLPGQAHIKGSIDEIRLFNYAMTAVEIKALGGACSHDSDLVPCDGCVTVTELWSYLSRWKNNEAGLTLPFVMEAIKEWKGGC